MHVRRRGTAAPYIVWMLAFTAAPLLLVIYFAFTDSAGRFTLANLTGLADYTSVFFLSLISAVVATVICLIISYPISFILSRMRRGRQWITLMLVMLPMWMNFLLRTYAWMSLLEGNGFINRFLGLFGIPPLAMINTAGAVVLGMVYNYLPYMVLPLYTSLCKIDNAVIEAAEDLGAGMARKVTRVLIPMSKQGIQTGITMVFVPSISTFIISKMLGGGHFWLLGDLIESQFLGNSYNYNLGSAMSLVLMIVVLLCMTATGGFEQEDAEGII